MIGWTEKQGVLVPGNESASGHWPCPRSLQASAGFNVPDATLVGRFWVIAEVEDSGKLSGDVAAVSAMLGRLIHRRQVLNCGPQSRRIKLHAPGRQIDEPVQSFAISSRASPGIPP